jgi:dihydrofolate reductase
MIGAIWAQTAEGVIGRDGKIPWRHPGDFARFKRVTMGSAVIMGRKTWESIGKPLPGRTNVVVTGSPIRFDGWPPDTAPYLMTSPAGALALAKRLRPETDIWFIGGRRIYEAAMPYVDVIDVTYVPDSVPRDGSVLAPAIDGRLFEAGAPTVHEDDPRLIRREWRRR